MQKRVLLVPNIYFHPSTLSAVIFPVGYFHEWYSIILHLITTTNNKKPNVILHVVFGEDNVYTVLPLPWEGRETVSDRRES